MKPRIASGAITSNFACALAMFLWAAAFPANEILLETWGAIALTFIKLGLGVPFLMAAWIWIDGWDKICNAHWVRGILVGGIGFGFGGIIFMIGQELSDAVTPAIAAAMMPVAGASLEVVIERRHLTLKLLLGIFLALVGGFFATGARLGDGNYGFGTLLCLIAVVLFAWGTRATTRDFQSLSIVGQTTITISGALVFCALAYLIFFVCNFPGVKIGLLDTQNINLMIVIVFISFIIAQTMWIWGAGNLGILLASFHMNAVPFYVMLILVLLMEKAWNWDQTFGAFLVALGVIMAQANWQKKSNF